MFDDLLVVADTLDPKRHRIAGDLASLDLLRYLAAGTGSTISPGISPTVLAMELVSDIAALERIARHHEARAEQGTADEARDARKRAEEIRADALERAEALPPDWFALITSATSPPPAAPPTPVRIGKW